MNNNYFGLGFDLTVKIIDHKDNEYKTFNLGQSGLGVDVIWAYLDRQLVKNERRYAQKIKKALSDVEERMIFEISSNMRGNENTPPWSESYRNWRTVQKARGMQVQGDRMHVFSGKFADSLRKSLGRELEKSPDQKVLRSGDSFILNFHIGHRGHIQKVIEQIQFGQLEGHPVGQARKSGLKFPPMIWPLTEAQAMNPKLKPDIYIGGKPVKFIASRGVSPLANPDPRTGPTPRRPLLDEEFVERVFRERMKELVQNFTKR